jgi:hypothetical protein
VGGQRHASAALPPGKTRYPLYRMLGGPQVQSERLLKIAPPPGIDPRTVQPVESRYTDCALPTHVGIESGVYVTELQESSALRVPCGPLRQAQMALYFDIKLISGLKNKIACDTGHL